MPNDTVTITRAEYTNLLDDRDFLLKLYEGGLEGWEGYDEAVETSEEEKG